MRINLGANCAPRFRLLSEDQTEALVSSSMELLERVGVRIHEKSAVALLTKAGAVSPDGVLVKIPAPLVHQALMTVPNRIVLSGRDGGRQVVAEKDQIYFGTGSDCPFFVDPETGGRNPTVFSDVVKAATVADALPHIDFLMSLGLVSEVPRKTYDRHQFLAMVTGTSKPLIITSVDGQGLRDQYEMACAIVGGSEQFRLNPLFSIYAEPSSPFVHGKEATEKLLAAAALRIPVVFVPAPSACGTAPATLAGVLSEGLADTLAGLVVSQLASPGAPFVMGGVFTALDMRSMVFSYGAPELLLMDAALSDLGKHLGMPVFSTAGCSDAKQFDQQAGLEAGLSILMAALSGASLIHDVGYLESGLLGSLDMLVFSNEAISMVKRMMRGIPISRETLAEDVIAEVGPGGYFSDHEHTVRFFKEEIWIPEILDRQGFSGWMADGRKSAGDRVRERVKDILRTHVPLPLEEKLVQELKAMIRKAEQRNG